MSTDSSIWDTTPVMPADEVLPPELPASPVSANASAWDRLREFFGCLLAEPRDGESGGSESGEGESDDSGVLAMLRAPSVLKSGVAQRAALAELCGYASELEFSEDSQQLATAGATPWFATPDKVHGGWVIWCDHPAP